MYSASNGTIPILSPGRETFLFGSQHRGGHEKIEKVDSGVP